MKTATTTILRLDGGKYEVKVGEQSLTIVNTEMASLVYALRAIEAKWVRVVSVVCEAVEP